MGLPISSIYSDDPALLSLQANSVQDLTNIIFFVPINGPTNIKYIPTPLFCLATEAVPSGLLACLHQLNYTNSKQPNIVQKVTQATVPPQSWFLHGATSFFFVNFAISFFVNYIS